MNFGFTEQQELLRSEVRKFLDEQCPIAEVRRIAETPEGYSEVLWKQLAELGWLGLTLPEEYGGAGLDWVDLLVLLEETGRTLFPSPLLATTLAASAVLSEGDAAQRSRWLPALADGSCIGSLALLEESDSLEPAGIALRGKREGAGFVLDGVKRHVSDPQSADLLVLSFRTGEWSEQVALALVDTHSEGVEAESFPTLDATKRLGAVRLNGVRIADDAVLGTPGEAWPAISRLLDRGAIAVCAEATGAADGLHAMTVQYAKDRIQFGHPIGHFQGVKHPLAEMYVQLESARSLLYRAAWALAGDPESVPRSTSLAKAFTSDAFIRFGIDCIQFHGAFGYTEDCNAQLYFRRSKWARSMFGDADHHYQRIAQLRGL